MADMPVAIASRPFPGEQHCGDQTGFWRSDNKLMLCIIDGLGHGRYAEAAAKMAINYIVGHLSESLTNLFAGCNVALRNSRGVAMGLAVIDESTKTLTYAGIGNTRAILVSETQSIYLSSRPGIVGGGYKKLTPETHPFKSGDRLFLFTDGLPETLNFSNYPAGLWADGQRLAEILIANYGRESDDAAILIYPDTNR